MKAWVYVSLKKTVLDPQGKAIQAALVRQGHAGISGVRQGKVFELELASGGEAMRREVERIARDVLANPVIEEYSLRFEE